MALPVTAITASALSLILVVLTLDAVRLRKRLGVAFGDGGNPRLLAAIRAHGNLIEYMPIGLTQLALLEGSGAPRTVLALLATGFVLSRAVHAYGVRVEGDRIGPRRSAGILLTIAILAAMSLWLVVIVVAAAVA